MARLDYEALTDTTFYIKLDKGISLIYQLGGEAKCRHVVRQIAILQHVMTYDPRRRVFEISEHDAGLHLPQLMELL